MTSRSKLTVQRKVFAILFAYPETRDDDGLLYYVYAKCYVQDSGRMYSLKKLFQLIPFKTIDRCRRRLQAKYPNLRGEMWNRRHILQEEWREEFRADAPSK